MAWLSGWNYRKSHVINSASGAGTNYQIKIKVHYGSGSDSGEDVYLNSKCRTDFGDIRFTDDDGTTLLDYWMETKVDSDYAIFWVEVKDDLSSSDVTIYIYYGKSGATTTSDIKKTFFDEPYHFDTDESSEWSGNAWTWDTANSLIKTTSNKDFYYISNYSYGRNKKYVVRMGRFGSGSNQFFGLLFGYQNSQNYYWVFFDGWSNKLILRKVVSNTSSNLASASFTPSVGTYYNWEVNWYSNGRVKVYINGTLKIDYSSLTDWTSGKFGLRAFGDDINVRCDWVFVAKALLSPPSHGSWGCEEEAPTYDPPVVETMAPIVLSNTSIKLRGKVLDLGSGDSITTRKIIYSIDGSYNTFEESGTFGLGLFSYEVDNLSTGSTITHRAIAISNVSSTGYGEELSFVLEQIPITLETHVEVVIGSNSSTIPLGDITHLEVVRPVLSRGVSSAHMRLQNFNESYTSTIDVGNTIRIYASRDSSNLGDNDTLLFTGEIIEINYEGVEGPEFYMDITALGIEMELSPAPELVQKDYIDTNGKSIIEDVLSLCPKVEGYTNKFFDCHTECNVNSNHTVRVNEVQPYNVITQILDEAMNPNDVVGFDAYADPVLSNGKARIVAHLRGSYKHYYPIAIVPKYYNCKKDKDRVRNKVTVYGRDEKCNITDDSWCESLDNWSLDNGSTIDLSTSHVAGTVSVHITHQSSSTISVYQCGAILDTGGTIDCATWKNSAYKYLRFQYRHMFGGATDPTYIKVQLREDDSNYFQYVINDVPHQTQTWYGVEIPLGENYEVSGEEGESRWYKVGNPHWDKITKIKFMMEWVEEGAFTAELFIDDVYFYGARYSYTYNDSDSQNKYGTRVHDPVVNDRLKSDTECELFGKGIIERLKEPLKIVTSVMVDGDSRFLPGDLVNIVVENDNIDNWYRIVEVRHVFEGYNWITYLSLSHEPREIDYIIRELYRK